MKVLRVEFLICCIADVFPPVFMSCPSDIFASITENSSASVNWTFPVATDNSNQAPQITVSPVGVTSPYTFYTSTVITYTATDASGNKDKCSFEVFLKGQKIQGHPKAVFCKISVRRSKYCLEFSIT